MSESSWIDKPGNREKFAEWLRDAQAIDHAHAVATWPWYGRLVHWTRRCPACAHARRTVDSGSQVKP